LRLYSQTRSSAGSRAVLKYTAVDDNTREPEDQLANERSARIEAERASHLKDEFLATLGHELRNPLNAILGWARLIELGRLSPEEAHGGAQTIVRNVRVLSQIVSDVLDVSSMVSGKTRIDPEETDVCEVIEATLENLKSTAEAHGIELHKELATATCIVFGDPHRLQQIMSNLVSNAVKFTPRRGRVTVSLECTGASCRIAVRDTGDGIAREVLPFVFDRFRQTQTSQGGAQRGLGLGLAIVKQLVELHGGSVAVESAGVGHGTTFTVTLPRLASLEELAGEPPSESNGELARG
jgi:signal transduction histidine kinase